MGRLFDDPIVLSDGRAPRTLLDAGEYVAALPKDDRAKPHWQTAAEMLMMAAEGRRPLMFAYIAMMQALHVGKPHPARAPRKTPAKTYRLVR